MFLPKWLPMKALILGASSKIGQALFPEINKRGWAWGGPCSWNFRGDRGSKTGSGSVLLFLLLFVIPAAASAYNPMAKGHFDVNYSMGFGRRVQEVDVNFGSFRETYTYENLGSYVYGGAVDLGLGDFFSLGAALSAGSLGYMETTYTSTATSSGEYVEEGSSSRLIFDGGLSLHWGALAGPGFDLDSNANPTGRLYYPRLDLGYSRNQYASASRVVAARGGWAGYVENFSGQSSNDSYSFGLRLPLATWVTLGLAYDRQFSRSANGKVDGTFFNLNLSSSDGGREENFSLLAHFYLNFLESARLAKPGEYFPGIGRVNVPKLRFNYGWTNSFKEGKALDRSYLVAVDNAFAETVAGTFFAAVTQGLDLSYDYMLSPGYSTSVRRETRRDPIGYSVGLRLSFAFGARAWGSQGQPTWKTEEKVEVEETEAEKQEREDKEALRREMRRFRD